MYFYLMLSALNERDKSFVEKLYNDYGGFMYFTAYDVLKNTHDAEDAVNDAMIKIMKHLSKFEGQDSKKICNLITISIRSIIRNKAIDIYKKNKKHMQNTMSIWYQDEETDEDCIMDIPDDNADTQKEVITREECEAIKRALLMLKPEVQDTINLVYYCGYSRVEAADFLGISDNAVRARLFKARKKLKEILRKELNYCD